MRKLLILTVLMLFQGALALNAQEEVLEVKRVDLDGLVNFMSRELDTRIYYVKDAREQSTFSVRAPRGLFLQEAEKVLSEKGYNVSSYDGALFILHSRSFSQNLPTGFFDSGEVKKNDDELRKYLSSENAVAIYQNKVYEIGEKDAGRSGKVYVSGHVRDVSTGEPLVGVSVYDNGKAYTSTDADGFYRVLLPVGDNVLNYSGYSLEDMHLNLAVYDDGSLDVVMKEKVTALTGVVISADNVSNHRDARMGIDKVRVNTIAKVPAAFGEADVLKVVLTLPGVKSVGEASSGFNVRGGSSDQNLILFNDGTVYNPSHMFGLFSTFNTDVINDIELYKSSIPAEFGGRISSVLDVRGREGNSNKFAGSVGIGLLTSRFHVEGPISKGRTSFILGGRTTYSNWILNLIPEGNSSYAGGSAGFRDLNAGISHHFNEKNSIHAYAYLSHDDFSFKNDTTFRYENMNFSLKWRSNFNERNSLVVSAGYDSYKSAFDNDFNPQSGYSISTGTDQAFAKMTFKSTLNEHHTLSYGINGVYYMLNPGRLSPLYEKTLVKERTLDQQNGLELAAYLSDAWTVDDRLSFEAGVRMPAFLALHPNKFYGFPELRLSGKYSFRDNLSLKAGFNSMNQYIHLISNTSSISPMDTWQLSSDKIAPQKGWQAAAGLYWTAGGQVDISLEGYWKRMYNYLDYKSGAVLVMNENLADYLVPTYGKAYGVELLVKKTVGKLNGWFSYTYARTFLKEMQDRGVETINRGEWYNAPHDKPHDFKLVANYKFTHRYSLSVNVDYSTGRPVTIPNGQYVYGNGWRLAYSDRNAYRIPDYFRMDVAMNIEPSHYLRQLSHLSVTLGVYNVTGRKNAYSIYYTTSGGTKVTGHMLSVFACPIPYINLNLKF